MKKLVVFIAVCISLTSTAQFAKVETTSTQVGKVTSGGVSLAALSFIVAGTDTVYILTYKDKQYTTMNEYKTISFAGGSLVLTCLYDALKDATTKEKGTEQNFKLGESSVYCKSKKKAVALVITTKGVMGIMELNTDQLDELFSVSKTVSN